ncbi:MAG: putative permease YjgP/YjgQ family protein [Syntrophorhabdaceae bacterium PtaU1.Bin034]|jgi:lipopolysaccharide export system permease protein|nr:MAG: putative permease YjgP/YjgQ family protein [Syntrophorhabdaceae bacterium PtaU1.Bin034]
MKFFFKKFYLYLLKELLLLFFLSLSVFTFILVVSRLGKMADLVVNKGVDLKDIILLIAYSSPPFLTFTLPMAFLLSSVVVLGRLSSENEVLALKASGVNLKNLFVPVSILGVAVFFAGFLNSSLLLSKSSEAFRTTLADIAKKGISIEDREGIFNDSIPGVVIYIDKVDTKNRNLSGIIISDDRDEGVRQTVTAEMGTLNVDSKTFDLSFLLKNGSLQRWEKQQDTYRSLSFKDYTFALNLESLLRKGDTRKRPYEMDINELRKAFSNAKDENKYDFALEIYKKISVPFSIVAFVLLTVPLGVKRKTEGKFSGVVYSLLIFIAYYILTAVTENVGKVYEVQPLLVCFLPNIVFSLAGIYLIVRINNEDQGRVFANLKRLWEPLFAKTK